MTLQLLVLFVLTSPVGVDGATDLRAEQMIFDPRTRTWSEVPAPEPGTPAGDLALARRLLADEAYGQAVKAIRDWLETYGPDHARSRAARLCLAEALFGQREYFKAHEQCAELIAEGSSDQFSAKAAELEFVVAEVFLSGTRRKWLGMRILSGTDLAISILDRLSYLHTPPRIGEYALKTKADHYFEHGDFDLAYDEYGKLLSGFPNSPYVPWIALRQAQTLLARFPGTRFDDAALVEAEYLFIEYRKRFPAAAEAEDVDLILEDIRNTRAQKEYEIGEWYQKVGQARAADFYYRSVVNNWPGTVAATRAESELARATFGEQDAGDIQNPETMP